MEHSERNRSAPLFPSGQSTLALFSSFSSQLIHRQGIPSPHRPSHLFQKKYREYVVNLRWRGFKHKWILGTGRAVEDVIYALFDHEEWAEMLEDRRKVLHSVLTAKALDRILDNVRPVLSFSDSFSFSSPPTQVDIS